MGKMMKKFGNKEKRLKRKADKKTKILRETLDKLGYDLEGLQDGTAEVSERAQLAGTLDLAE
jgi:hypothetical protein